MSVETIDELLRRKRASLRLDGENLVIQGPRTALKDPQLLSLIRATKADLVAELRRGGLVGAHGDTADVPANLIDPHCKRITPELLPLVQLSQAEIDRVVANVPGGASNVQDIYGLAPLQEGILFHHLLEQQSDPYLLATLFSFVDRSKLDKYVEALNATIERHDILRTAVVWEELSEPVQVVWRHARLQVEEVTFDRPTPDVAAQLRQRFHPQRYRMDITRAPIMRMYVTYDPVHHRWLGLRLHHHIVLDHMTTEVMHSEVKAFLSGRAAALPPALPFRRFVVQARRPLALEEREAFFRKMLGDVEEPTAPFGLKDAHEGSAAIAQSCHDLDSDLAARLRTCARMLGVSASSLFHVAWAQLLARTSGQSDPVFGTVVFGRMHGDAGTERVLGPFINTLPVRISLSEVGVERCIRRTHELLAQLVQYEQAPLAEVQQYSNVPAGSLLFTALFNYRHGRRRPAQEHAASATTADGIEVLWGEERTHYPVTLSVDDWGDGFSLTAQVVPALGAQRLCSMMLVTLEELVAALETRPAQPVSMLEVLPAEERRQLLSLCSEVTEYPHDQCIHELFELRARSTPDAIAVTDEVRHLTYRELNLQANLKLPRFRGQYGYVICRTGLERNSNSMGLT
jgi:hypothetical protein